MPRTVLQCIGVREMVYADDIYLMASSPEQLQALIDALSSCCAMLHMEISIPKTKIMVFSPVPAPAVEFSCNDSPIEQEYHFKALGPSFHPSGAVVHLISPIRSKGLWFLGCCPATAFFAAVWQEFQFAVTSIARCLGACLAVWVSSVGHARVLLLLDMLVWICSACMITTSEQPV